MNTWISTKYISTRASCQYMIDIWSICVRNTIDLCRICNKGITTIKKIGTYLYCQIIWHLTWRNIVTHGGCLSSSCRMFQFQRASQVMQLESGRKAAHPWSPLLGSVVGRGWKMWEKLYRGLCILARVAVFSHSLVLPKWRWCMEHGLQNSRWGWFGPHGNQISHWEVNIFGTFVIRSHQKVKNNPFF